MFFANVELPVLIVYTLMVIGFIIMVWGIKSQEKKSYGRLVMIFGALIVFGAFAASFTISGTKSEDARMMKNKHVFLEAKAEKIAEYIAERFPEEGSAAFLIDEESYSNSSSENYQLLQEIKSRLDQKGIACEDELVVGLSKQVVDKKTGEATTVSDDPIDATILKKTLDQVNDKVFIVVNFVGLPNSLADLRKITFLTRKNTSTGKNNMLLLSEDGLPYVEQDMLKSGRVCAVIDYATDEGMAFSMQKDNAPKDLSEAFDLMYYFINPRTVASFISQNPYYFVTK